MTAPTTSNRPTTTRLHHYAGRYSDYRECIADHQLRHALARAGAVVIEGPKALGKSETMLQCARSVVEVDTDPTSHSSRG